MKILGFVRFPSWKIWSK